MLNIKNLTKNFKKKEVLTNINTSFSLNGTSIIVGLNGSGKTTLLNIITTLTKPDFGNVFLIIML
ncbi:ATP-binding cassette domain-containing protein [Staphylococcus aureus]|uniref:ATP-binding cassette domain-containing protein n=1 Tax=Staphylococcus aureus TaxID=1280 RepID=UPI002B2609C1|nr:ATP-binding cassette domain-containing protein [Staphylococcus aureus]WQK93309.1 ATP-binding cassette domain-containing protein [Staphylococcus aureus]